MRLGGAAAGVSWRTVIGPSEAQNPGLIIWEYRGKDSKGAYRVHIEFDHRDVVALVARIPDNTGIAPARMVK